MESEIMGANRTALDVADQIVRLSQRDEIPVTHMQVQKLAYFCHAWMLGLGHGPLFQDAVESWQHGPVIRSLYHALKRYRKLPVRECLLPLPAEFTPTESHIIEGVWRNYGEKDGLELSGLTHAEGTPWHQTFSRGKHSQVIPNFLIRDYYAAIVAQARNATGKAT